MPADLTSILAVANAVVPEIAPEVMLIMGIISAFKKAHAGQYPSPEQVDAGYKAATQSIADTWAAWIPSGDGSLPAAPQVSQVPK